MESPAILHAEGLSVPSNSGPHTSFSPKQCLQYFLPLPSPNKTHQLLQSISGLGFFMGLFVFYFKYWKSPWALWSSPRSWFLSPTLNALFPAHCPFPRNKSISRTAFSFFFLKEQLTLSSQLALQNQRSCFASVICRSTGAFIWYQVSSHNHTRHLPELEPPISLLHFLPLPPTPHQPPG